MAIGASRIAGVGVAHGSRVVTNQDLEQLVDTSDEWIRARTGIRERRLAADGLAASDLAFEAGERALAAAGVDASELDLIICATVTPDMPFPATACLVQARLGARGAACFDLEAGCTGFLYAQTVADQFVSTGRYRNALVIGVELLSRITDWQDRSTCVLFGDGAGAVVLSPSRAGRGILASHLGSDGGGADLLCQPAGGSRRPATAETVAEKLHCIRMNGSEVFKFAVKVMSQASLAVLRRCGLRVEDVALWIPHQANVRIIEAAVKRLRLDPERVIVNIERYGNMSSASVPVALSEALEDGRVRDGDIIVMVAFGAGLTWGACAVRW